MFIKVYLKSIVNGFLLLTSPGRFNFVEHLIGRRKQMIRTLQKEIRRGRSTPGPEQENDVPVDLWKEAHEAGERFSAGG